MSFQKKNKPVKLEAFRQAKHLNSAILPSKEDLIQDQSKAERSLCIYGSDDDAVKWRKALQKCSDVGQIVVERGGNVATFSSPEEATSAFKAIKKLIKKQGSSDSSLVVCKDYAPPILVAGHQPDLFVLRDVPEELNIPDIWKIVKGDEICISHISFLPTSSRDVIIRCEEKENHEVILNKNGTRIDNWRVKVNLWFEFCFHMTQKHVIFIENLPEDSTVDSVKKLLSSSDSIDYMEVLNAQHCAFLYSQSKAVLELVTDGGLLKFSLCKHVAGLRYLVYIDNLHETTKNSHIVTFLSECGNVLKVTVSLNQKTGLKKAVVYFEDEESISKALELDNTVLLGQTISVKQHLDKTATSVFITNLHRGATQLDLCLIFQECGHIESVNLPKQKNTVLCREAAVIKFSDTESVRKALEKSNKNKIRGMRLVVHKDDPFENRGKRGKARRMKRRESWKGRDGPRPSKLIKLSY